MTRSDSVRFWIGSDEGMEVWIDGASIYSYEGRRRHTLGMVRVPGYLEAGEHRLLVRADQRRGRFEFSFNVCEPIDDEFYGGNRYPGVRYYLDESMPARRDEVRVRAENVSDDGASPYFESNIEGTDPVEMARSVRGPVELDAPADLEVADLLGVAAVVTGIEAPHIDTVALACLSALPFDMGYAGLHGWFPRYGPRTGRLMAWLGLRYDIRSGFGLRESNKGIRGWLVSGRAPLMAVGDNVWGAVTGHREVNGQVELRTVSADTSGWFRRDQPQWAQLPGREWERGTVVVVEPAGPPLSATVLCDSLAALAVELALVRWTEQEAGDWGPRRFPAGVAGWDELVIAWERTPFTPEWGRQNDVGWSFSELREWSLPMWRDGRRRGSAFFLRAAETAEGEEARYLRQAAAGYGESAEIFARLQAMVPEKVGEGMGPEDEARLEQMRLAKPLLRQARAAERRALSALASLIGAPDLPPAREDPLRLADRGIRLATWQAELSQGVYELCLHGAELGQERLAGREAEGVTSQVLRAPPQEEGWQLVVEAVKGMGRYVVRQQPNAENGWEAIVRIDDAWTRKNRSDLVIWAVPSEP